MMAPPKPPRPDELEALIKEARERQLRRRLLGAVGIAVVAALGLGAYALIGGGSPANLAQPPAQGGRVIAPLCRASQLSATVGFQGATQTLVGGADVKNVSDRPCSLPGKWPRVRITAEGKRLAVVQRRPPGYRRFPEKPARVLVPGKTATVEMQWANWCGGPHAPVSQGGIPLAPLKTDFTIDFGRGLMATAATSNGPPPCLAAQSPSTLIVDRARDRS